VEVPDAAYDGKSMSQVAADMVYGKK